MNKANHNIKVLASSEEIQARQNIVKIFKETPIPEKELLTNLGLYSRRQVISRIVFLNELYQKIVNVHGVIMEFGVRWGQNLALFQSLRGIYEPFNYNRKVVGFDTFSGFASIHAKDGNSDVVEKGNYGTSENYENYLSKVLDYHEQESPLPHIKKYEIVKGDAGIEINNYLKRNPETIIALAFFDMDMYEPTKKCLEAIRPHLTKGSVLVFDELNFHDFPGETLALKEVLGLDKVRLMRHPFSSVASYLIVE